MTSQRGAFIPLNLSQRRIVSLAWITYASYYLVRVNVSVALPDMQASLGLSKTDVGLISTGFFWAYALGQLINGPLGDRISPRRFIFFGMLGSAVVNLLFGSFSSWLLLLLLWMINGYFQATGWGPILRTLANWLDPKQRTRVSGVFGSSFVVGTALTWLLTGWLVEQFGWRMAFWVPGALTILMAFLWRSFARDHPDGHQESEESAQQEPISLRLLLIGVIPRLRKMWSLVIASVCLGFVLVALTIWLPTYFVEVADLDIGAASQLSALLPVAGIAGTLLIGWISGRFWVGREAAGLTAVIGLLVIAFAAFPLWSTGLFSNVIMIMVIGAGVYGATSLLLGTMALVHGGEKNASSAAGLIDFSFNIGAGFSGGVIGAMLTSQPWSAVFASLAVVSLASAIFVILPVLQRRKFL
jgi:sugar phosphate permease